MTARPDRFVRHDGAVMLVAAVLRRCGQSVVLGFCIVTAIFLRYSSAGIIVYVRVHYCWLVSAKIHIFLFC